LVGRVTLRLRPPSHASARPSSTSRPSGRWRQLSFHDTFGRTWPRSDPSPATGARTRTATSPAP
jgi:hypothetical protein